ncbi:MAG: hypothetical protein A2744_02210 [Candidatus Buchananbacteria bacterium RIFCSPHIGHO2_01_FULL_44_11]|uniref:Glycosyltransferase RgtA/B/C/D-like domain-containing protein n=1 Tax=Candidatus Buchananbacteria bacterium RIFCSPHIGHO2_01_FULL_44_11 TaxID=1797535 RepID=A0A1G1XZH0_9BACT|nr:MAG: hypothetical protein A2744_02210 [Candidatus Buchananbacteria bacterium RIFCSPHIGHO2_01_FULL_44_11]
MIKKQNLVLLPLALIFLAVNFWLVTPVNFDQPVGYKFDWPDEVANYFWVNQYAQSGQLSIPEPLNAVAQNQIHPRSFNVSDSGSLLPGSFLGLILIYGSLVKVFSQAALIYFTPILSVLAVLAFYGIIRRIFSEPVGVLSAVIMFFHPAWWYYSLTSMLPNVAFIACTIFSLYFLIVSHSARIQLADDGTWGRLVGRGQLSGGIGFYQLILSALFAGLAIAIRPSEIIWLLVIFFALFFYWRRGIKPLRLALFLTIVVLILIPSFNQNYILYGSFFSTGYDQLQNDSAPVCSACQAVQSLILPFGFHPFLIGYNFLTHFILRLWWLALPAILGLVVYLSQRRGAKTEIFAYILAGLAVSAILAVYYGSWEFSDKLTLNLNTLGISYVRYWLPIYLFSLPLVATALLWLIQFFPKRLSGLVLLIVLTFIFYRSADLVLRAKPDSILPVRQRILEYRQDAAQVISVTEPEAVIITVRKDKLFFPERKVIHTFDALSLNKQLLTLTPELAKLAPVYYFALGPEPTTEFTEGFKLKTLLKLDHEILYQVILD